MWNVSKGRIGQERGNSEGTLKLRNIPLMQKISPKKPILRNFTKTSICVIIKHCSENELSSINKALTKEISP